MEEELMAIGPESDLYWDALSYRLRSIMEFPMNRIFCDGCVILDDGEDIFIDFCPF